MSKYLITGSYAADGVKGLMQEGGSKRLAAATAAIESVGGSIDSFYYSCWADDVVGICDIPDSASATAVSMMINSTGAVTLSLTPLITVDEVDAAAAKHRRIGRLAPETFDERRPFRGAEPTSRELVWRAPPRPTRVNRSVL